MEFAEPSNVAQALVLNDSTFHDRPLKVYITVSSPQGHYLIAQQVTPKRTNVPGMHRGRGRGGFGRGGYRGGYRGAPRGGGYRGAYRGRGRGYAPY